MNVDREAKDYTEEDIADVRAQLNAHYIATGQSWADISRAIGPGAGAVASSTLSAFANDTYAGGGAEKARNVAWRVNRFLQAEEARRTEALHIPDIPGFVMTKTARQMMAQLQFAHMGKISVMVGESGLGKTETIKRYCAINPPAFHIQLTRAHRTPGPLLSALTRATGRPIKGRSAAMFHMFDDLVARLKDLRAVVVVDEAQHANDDSLDLLRQIHDATGCGLVLAGNPTVLGRVQSGVRQPEFAQIHSRVSWPQVYSQPYPEDVEILCDAWGVPKGALERAFLQKVAAQPGALRSVTQTLFMATVDAGLDEEPRTFSHIKAAWTQQKRQPVAA